MACIYYQRRTRASNLQSDIRPISKTLSERLDEPRRFIQALIGPRQTGKTTIARQIISGTHAATHYASADEPMLRDRTWIEQQWEIARLGLKSNDEPKKGILVLKEFKVKKKILVGFQGIPLENFLCSYRRMV